MTRGAVISLFSGALGLDLGLERAGFAIRVAVESDPSAAKTIRGNRPDIPVIERRIEDVTTEEILATAGLAPGEAAIVSGGPACQAFSTAGRRRSIADPRGRLFEEFARVVREARPRFFVMENVKGAMSAAIRHRKLKERGPGFPPLEPEEELGSAFLMILRELKATGYAAIFDVLNSADFGVAQTRERLVFLGTRDGEAVAMPIPTHSRYLQLDRQVWVTLRDALQDLADDDPSYRPFSETRQRFIAMTPEGGNWRDLPTELQREALGGAYDSWGGRSGFYRRLAWDKPAPALTTQPDSKATMLCHPAATRPLTIKEYGRIQQFPDGWSFAGSLQQQYSQAGNAVPVGLAEAIGRAFLLPMTRFRPGELSGVTCPNARLVARLANRPRTILNPSRLRPEPGTARDWLGGDRIRRGSLVIDGQDATDDAQLSFAER